VKCAVHERHCAIVDGVGAKVVQMMESHGAVFYAKCKRFGSDVVNGDVAIKIDQKGWLGRWKECFL
jgi:hypothetical protein